MSTIHAPPEPATMERPPYPGHAAGERSLAGLVMELRDEATDLIKNEIRLARAELTDKAQEVKHGVISSVTGGAILYAGFALVLLAAAAGLYAIFRASDMSPFIAGWLAPLIIGGITLLVGLAMVMAGKNKMTPENLRPDRTERSLHETRDWAERTAERTADHMRPGRGRRVSHETRDWAERNVT